MNMKSSMMLLGVVFLFFACNDVRLDPGEQQGIAVENQQWKLVRMSGSFVNSETTGTEMEWQESYVLQENGDFTKTREVDGTTLQAVGTYQIVELSDGPYFEFTYRESSVLIGNCTGDLKELLSFRENTLYGTWQACDGPGLEYERD